MTATTRHRPLRAAGMRTARAREPIGLIEVIPELVPSPCIARSVDVPGSTPDCNMSSPPSGLARGPHNALAVQSLQEPPRAPARPHSSHLWHDRDASARTVVLPGL